MTPRMSEAEIALFGSFIRNSANYLEFGSGGSTFVATQVVKESVRTVDSSEEWLKKVQDSCVANNNRVVPTLEFIDVGATGEWGYPTDPATKAQWPSYYTKVWSSPGALTADLYMVDGRFRVACFLSILKNCDPSALIMFHDYASRDYYHLAEAVARKVATAEDLAVFLPVPQNCDKVAELLKAYALDPR